MGVGEREGLGAGDWGLGIRLGQRRKVGCVETHQWQTNAFQRTTPIPSPQSRDPSPQSPAPMFSVSVSAVMGVVRRSFWAILEAAGVERCA
jgi:hypothetical protein